MRSPARPSEKRTAAHHVTMIAFGRMQTMKTASGSSAGRPVCNAAVKAQPTLTSAPSQERALEAVRSRVSRNCDIRERLRVRSGIHERRPNRRTRSMTEAA